MQKIVTILFFVIQLLIITRLVGQTIANKQTQSAIQYALFNSPTDIDLVFYKKHYKPTKLTKEQLIVAQSIIKGVSDSLNFLITSTNTNTGVVDTLKHVFQIVTAKNSKGQVFLWINAICEPDKEWRRRIVFVDDGGSCYYKFKIDLAFRKYFAIEINSSG